MWKKTVNYYYLFAVLLLVGVTTTTLARSTGAPTCINNRAAPGEEHKEAGFEQRRMSDGFIKITLDGEEIEPGYPVRVELNTNVAFKIEARTPVKGIMARISGGIQDVNTREVFILNDGEANLKSNEFCDLDIGGVTHTNSEDKQVFEWTFRFTEVAVNMLLDISIVETKTPISRFYYDQYILTAGADVTAPPTRAPTPDKPNNPSPSPPSGATKAKVVAATTGIVTMVTAALWTMLW